MTEQTTHIPIEFEKRQLNNVGEFYSSALDGNDPHRYPGERPEASFVTDGVTVAPVGFSEQENEFLVMASEGVKQLDAYLRERSAPELGLRIPVVSYGSNLCPPTLRKKLTFSDRPDLGVLPVIYGWMKGVDAVWGERPGQRGAFAAEMYTGPETEQTRLRVGVGLFTPEQLLFVHRTEQNYEFGQFDRVTLDNGVTMPALMYAGSGRILTKDGSPVAVEAVERTNSGLAEMSSRQALEYILGFEAVKETVCQFLIDREINVENYTQHVLSLSLTEKNIIRDVMTKTVRKAGISSEFSMSGIMEVDFSWSNPSTLPTFAELTSGHIGDKLIRLPEQEVVLPTNASSVAIERRRSVLSGVKKHWHNRNPR